IKTSSPVSSITQDKDGVTVRVGSVGYQADYVIVAVPLRALAKISMIPSLDAQHMGAIKGTNYGWRDQIMLKFKTPVWEPKARMSGEIYSNTGLGMLWIEPALKGGANVVINLSGDNARVMQAFGDKQMVDQVLIRLHAFYPQARGSFTGYEIRRYSTDPSMGGAYLAFGPGQISKYWRLWERPVQRITFAGEHTDALYPGTLEGALRSGQRAASQAQDLLAGKSFDPAKAVPVAAAAAAGAAAAKDKGGFFSNMFGGGSGKTDKAEKAPAKAEPLKDEAKQDKPGFFSRLFGGADKPEVKAEPLAKADEVAPAPAAPTPVAPAVEAKQEAAKPAAAKPAATKATPAKHAPAHKPAAKQAHKPVEAKKATAKSAPAKKPVADTQAKAG
ncbi:MAG: FAD-dependent oxidoreductase, partial [Pseudomonas capeferrum]